MQLFLQFYLKPVQCKILVDGVQHSLDICQFDSSRMQLMTMLKLPLSVSMYILRYYVNYNDV